MEIQYTGHPKTSVSTTLSTEDLEELEELMRVSFLETLEYGTFDKVTRDILKDSNRARLIRFCERHGVDWEYGKDRVAFFQAILEKK